MMVSDMINFDSSVSHNAVEFTPHREKLTYKNIRISAEKNPVRSKVKVKHRKKPTVSTHSDILNVPHKPEITFSFAGSGWLKMYHFGVVHALQHYSLNKNARFTGASAGSLAAICLVIDSDMLMVKDVCMDNLREVRSNPLNGLCIRYYLNRALDLVVGEDRYNKHRNELNEQVEIPVTVLPGCHGKRYTKTRDYKHFKEVVLASCTAPPIAGLPFILDGSLVMDGGLADFQPLIREDTITVSPFYFHSADIKPSQYVPVWWGAYPPTREEYDRLFTLGYKDAITWMEANGYKAPPGYTTPEWSIWEEPTVPITTDPIAPVKTVETYRMDMYQEKIHSVIRKIEHLIGERTQDPEVIHVMDEQAATAVMHQRHRHLHKSKSIHYNPGRGHIQNPSGKYYLSDVGDFLLLFIMYMMVKPLTCLLLYAELLVLASASFLYLIFVSIVPVVTSKKRKAAFKHLADDLYSLSSVSILAQTLMSPTADVNRNHFKKSWVMKYVI
eukprot:CFRG8567T1